MGVSWISEGREEGEKVIGLSRRVGGVAVLRVRRALIVCFFWRGRRARC